MTIDEELRRTLRYAAEQVEPSADAWRRIADRVGAPGRGRRPRVLLALAAAAVVVAIVGAAVLFTSGDDGGQQVRSGPAAPSEAAGSFPGIWPEWTWSDYEKPAVDGEGWRLDPVQVSRRYVAERLNLPDAALGDFQPFDRSRGQVAYSSGVHAGVVVLARPGGGDSPYVVTRAASEGLTVAAQDDTLRNPLVLEIRTAVDGRGTALAGPFDTAPTAETGFRAEAESTQAVSLALVAPLPPALLVRVNFAGLDNVARVAELRVDAATSQPEPEEGDRLADDELVALGAEGVVVASTDNGEVRRTLADISAIGEGASGLTVAPGRNAVYYSRARTGCLPEIVAVDVASAALEVVVTGTWPALSPDGERLAYASDANCSGHDRLVVRTLATGEERVWAADADAGADDLPAKLRSLAWSPDGRTVGFEVVYEDGSEVRVLDTTSSATSVLDSTRLRPPDGRTWTAPVFDPGGRVVLIEGPEPGATEGLWSAVVVDPQTGLLTSETEPYGERIVDLAVIKGGVVLHLDARGRVHHFDVGAPTRLAVRPGWTEIAF